MLNEIEGAVPVVLTGASSPPQTKLPGRISAEPLDDFARQTPLAGLAETVHLTSVASQAEQSGQCTSETHDRFAALDLPDGHFTGDTQPFSAIGEIIIHHRRYEDLRRAYQRLDLQTKSIQRFAGESAPVEAWLIPYREAMLPLELAIKDAEKDLARFAKKLPVYGWSKDVKGLSERFLALVIGECGRGPGEYRTVSALWKRMGLAVIDGQRQRRVTGDAALVHGYVARRRALMWNIGESILKQQLRKDENGERYAIGPYGQVYIDRRAYEVETKGEKYSHARAKRYMEKRLLRHLWQEWRRACSTADSLPWLPAAEIQEAA